METRGNLGELDKQYVVVKEEYLKPEYAFIHKRIFLCEGGFGLHTFTAGTAIFGKWVYEGESDRISRQWVERLATKEEIADVLKHRLVPMP